MKTQEENEESGNTGNLVNTADFDAAQEETKTYFLSLKISCL